MENVFYIGFVAVLSGIILWGCAVAISALFLVDKGSTALDCSNACYLDGAKSSRVVDDRCFCESTEGEISELQVQP